jgi:hypothetical protein
VFFEVRKIEKNHDRVLMKKSVWIAAESKGCVAAPGLKPAASPGAAARPGLSIPVFMFEHVRVDW